MQPLICGSSNHRITETQNWGWMDFWSSPGPNSQLSHGQLQEGSVATWTKQGFFFYTDGDYTTPLGNLFQWPGHSASF